MRRSTLGHRHVTRTALSTRVFTDSTSCTPGVVERRDVLGARSMSRSGWGQMVVSGPEWVDVAMSAHPFVFRRDVCSQVYVTKRKRGHKRRRRLSVRSRHTAQFRQ
jgi:hypothetical protein